MNHKKDCPWAVNVNNLTIHQRQRLVPSWLSLLTKENGDTAVEWAIDGLASTADQLNAPQSAELYQQTARAIISIMQTEPNDGSASFRRDNRILLSGLFRIAPNLDREMANVAVGEIVNLYASSRYVSRYDLVRAGDMTSLCAHLSAEDCRRLAGQLVSKLSNRSSISIDPDRHLYFHAFSTLCVLLDRAPAPDCNELMIQVLEFLKSIDESRTIDAGLIALSPVTPKIEQSAVVRTAAATVQLTAKSDSALFSSEYGFKQEHLLILLASRLTGSEAIKVAELIVESLSKQTNEHQRDVYLRTATKLANQLDSNTASKLANAIVANRPSSRRMKHLVNYKNEFRALALLTRKMTPFESRRLRKLVLTNLIQKTSDENFVIFDDESLASIANSTDLETAEDIVRDIVLSASSSRELLSSSVSISLLKALAPRIGAPTLNQLLQRLIDELGNSPKSSGWDFAATCLDAIRPGMCEAQIDAFAVELINTLSQSPSDVTYRRAAFGLTALCEGLSDLRLHEAARVLSSNFGIYAVNKGDVATIRFFESQMHRVNSDDAETFAVKVSQIQPDANLYQFWQVRAVVNALAKRLSVAQTRKIVVSLLGEMQKAPNDDIRGRIVANMMGLVENQDEETARCVCNVAIQFLQDASDIKLHSKNKIIDTESRRVNLVSLSVLANKLGKETRRKFGRTLADDFRKQMSCKQSQFDVKALIAEVFPVVSNDDCVAEEFLPILLVMLDQDDGVLDVDPSDVANLTTRSIIGHQLHLLLDGITDVRQLVSVLKRPCCVGNIRAATLRRLEQLAFPQSKTDELCVGTTGAIGILGFNSVGPAMTVLGSGQAVGWERERKFRTIWDAVAWLKVHHPEIDLDAPYKPRR